MARNADRHLSPRPRVCVQVPNCKVDVPVVALGGGEIEPAPPSQDETDGLEKLYARRPSPQPRCRSWRRHRFHSRGRRASSTASTAVAATPPPER